MNLVADELAIETYGKDTLNELAWRTVLLT